MHAYHNLRYNHCQNVAFYLNSFINRQPHARTKLNQDLSGSANDIVNFMDPIIQDLI